MIDAKDSNNNDIDYQVTVDGANAKILGQVNVEDIRVLEVAFPADANQIIFIGTYVVPEFGEIFIPVLAVSSAAMAVLRIVMSRKTNSTPRL